MSSSIQATASEADDHFIVVLPVAFDKTLPSRSTVVAEGEINGRDCRVVLEPDGKLGHWFAVDHEIGSQLEIQDGSTVTLSLVPSGTWPEPTIPTNIAKALAADSIAMDLWTAITPMARWEWLRWVDSVKQESTRQARPAKLRSMLKAGKRRPCCFNRAIQTPPKFVELM